MLLLVTDKTDDDWHSNFTVVLFSSSPMCLETVAILICNYCLPN